MERNYRLLEAPKDSNDVQISWSEPYFGFTFQDLEVSASAPVFWNGTLIAVVFVGVFFIFRMLVKSPKFSLFQILVQKKLSQQEIFQNVKNVDGSSRIHRGASNPGTLMFHKHAMRHTLKFELFSSTNCHKIRFQVIIMIFAATAGKTLALSATFCPRIFSFLQFLQLLVF